MSKLIETGIKKDSGKLRWSLLDFKFMTECVKVLMFGAEKYPDAKNFQKVINGKQRYTDAAFRHLISWTSGEIKDKESGLHHLAHLFCCIMFAHWFERNNKS